MSDQCQRSYSPFHPALYEVDSRESRCYRLWNGSEVHPVSEQPEVLSSSSVEAPPLSVRSIAVALRGRIRQQAQHLGIWLREDWYGARCVPGHCWYCSSPASLLPRFISISRHDQSSAMTPLVIWQLLTK